MNKKLKFLPMAVTGIGSLVIMLVIILSGYVFEGGVIAAVIGGILFVVTVISKKLREVAVLFYLSAALIFSGIMMASGSQCSYNHAKLLAGDDALVVAKVTGESESRPSKVVYILETESVGDTDINVKLRLVSNVALDIYAGDIISFTEDVYCIDKFDSSLSRYYMSEGIYLGATIYDGEEKYTLIKDGSDTIACKLQLLRDEIKARIYSYLPNEYGSVAIGMLLGDTSGVSDETIASFKRSGVYHLFAVSGLHLSIWVMGVYTFLGKLGLSRRKNGAFSVIFTFFFMALSGFSPSVTRAGVMLIAAKGGTLLKREVSAINSLGFALMVLLLFNPMSAANVSLWLSFSATAGIITLYKKLEEKVDLHLSLIKPKPLGKGVKALVCTFLVSVTAVLFTLPVSCFAFGGISIMGPITNLFVAYPATVMMISAGICALLQSISFAGNLSALVCGIMAKLVIYITDKTGSVPFAMIKTESLILIIFAIILISITVCIYMLVKDSRKRVKALVSSVLVVSLIFVGAGVIYRRGLTTATVVDVDDGICIVVEKSGEKLILGSGSSDSYAYDKVEEEVFDSRASMLIVPDNNKWNSGICNDLIDRIEFERIISGEAINGVGSTVEPDFRLSPWDSGSIEFHKTEALTYAYCVFEATDMLIIFDCDEDAVISQHLDADVLVCSYYLPDSLDLSGFGNIIITSSKKVSEDMIKRYSSFNNSIYSTLGQQSLSLQMRSSREVEIFSE